MNLAICGTGLIVNEGALPALKEVPEISKTAIFARPHSKDKAEKLAEDFSIKKVYTDYDELLKDEEINFVYIGLINSVHYEYAKKALLAEKNVIVEKPFATTSKEVEEIKNLAEEKNLYVFEAITTLNLPNFSAIKEKLPQLGKIRAVTANFSQYSSRYDKYLQGEVAPAFDPKKFGGALYDLNIYNLNFIVGLFGEPDEVNYTANIGFNGVDTSGIVVMKYKNFFASAVAAKDSDSPSYAIIQGEKGYIRTLGKPNELQGFEINLRGSDKVEKISLNKFSHRMTHEFKRFAEIYNKKDFSAMQKGLETSLAVMKTAEKARSQIIS
ncbi:MAG: Gfo/Idh/MocA family oxidoreductase [Selenomonadaceae bacterium]|nr:Gfo/Idh/MocA family oxidoreductase [Selenomonadaceae bacterium]